MGYRPGYVGYGQLAMIIIFMQRCPYWPLFFPTRRIYCRFPTIDWISVPGRSGKILFTRPLNMPMFALHLVWKDEVMRTGGVLSEG